MNFELSQQQIYNIQKRLPAFELSYETIAHKKVFDSYQIGLAIPAGKKSFAWFSFNNDKDVCYILEINREKKIINITIADVDFDSSLSLGTILYGTIIPPTEENVTPFFVVEDIYYYKGISMKQYTFGEKLGYLEIFFSKSLFEKNQNKMRFFLPFLWGIQSPLENEILQEFESHRHQIFYQIHHLQLRKLNELSPYLNIHINNALSKISHKIVEKPSPKMTITTGVKDFNKPQYRYPTVFLVSADIQYDIYHLFAFGKNKEHVYYDIAYIQNLKVSKMMNDMFRNIRENKNLDYIEESDDEEDFENIAADKFVDLNKIIPMECIFHRKFKRWIPIQIVKKEAKIVHIYNLVNN